MARIKAPRPEGRPPFCPTEADFNTVKMMAACGFTQESIARCLGETGITLKTLRKYFRRDLEISADRANVIVGNKVFQAAEKGEAWAACFWLKCRGGWRENPQPIEFKLSEVPFVVQVTPADKVEHPTK